MSGFDPGNAARNVCFSLLYRGTSISLSAAKVFLIGRDPSCDIALDDRLVSRRHARISVTRPAERSSDNVVMVEDLESVNGVYVDGERIVGARALEAGQRIMIGGQEMLLVAGGFASRTSRTTRRERGVAASRSDGNDTPASGVRNVGSAMGYESPSSSSLRSASTERGTFVDVLHAVFEKLLANGRVDEAEHMMQRHLEDMLRHFRNEGARDPVLAGRCSEIALTLASATRRAEWVSYVLELHLALDQLPSAEHVDRLYELSHQLPSVPLALLRRYLTELETRAYTFGPAERFLLQRLQGLARMAAAR